MSSVLAEVGSAVVEWVAALPLVEDPQTTAASMAIEGKVQMHLTSVTKPEVVSMVRDLPVRKPVSLTRYSCRA